MVLARYISRRYTSTYSKTYHYNTLRIVMQRKGVPTYQHCRRHGKYITRNAAKFVLYPGVFYVAEAFVWFLARKCMTTDADHRRAPYIRRTGVCVLVFQMLILSVLWLDSAPRLWPCADVESISRLNKTWNTLQPGHVWP